MNKGINPIEIEQRALNTLIDKGTNFDVPMRSLCKLFSRKKIRMFSIRQPYLGTLDILADCQIKLELDEKALKECPVQESNKIIARSTKTAAKIVAIAVLNSRWKIKLFTSLLTSYFIWRIKPSKLAQLAFIIKYISNTGDFISSIRLMSGTIRQSQPKADLVEEKQKA